MIGSGALGWYYLRLSAERLSSNRTGALPSGQLLSPIPTQPTAMTRATVSDWFQRNKKKYRPEWGITLTGISTVRGGEEEAVTIVIQLYA